MFQNKVAFPTRWSSYLLTLRLGDPLLQLGVIGMAHARSLLKAFINTLKITSV